MLLQKMKFLALCLQPLAKPAGLKLPVFAAELNWSQSLTEESYDCVKS